MDVIEWDRGDVKDTNLYPPNISRLIRPSKNPFILFREICLGHANREFLEHPGKELEICKLYGINSDIVAKLDYNELVGGSTWAKHVSIFLGGEDGRS